MPFTLAHPIAVLPLARYGVASALVIGSMAPDFWYFLPVATREEAHSYAGLVWFCLPAALAFYLLFHGLLKRPLLALLPRWISERLAPYASFPRASWRAVIASLFAGMATHLAWDAFTHYDSLASDLLPLLRAELISIGPYDMHVFTLLQHVSSLAGMAALAVWAALWLRRAEPRPLVLAFELTATVKACVITGLGLGMAFGAASPLVEIAPQSGHDAIFAARAMARTTLAGATYGLLLGFLAYSLLWQVWARLQQPKAL